MKTRHAHLIRIGVIAARYPHAPRDLEWLNRLTVRAFERERDAIEVRREQRFDRARATRE